MSEDMCFRDIKRRLARPSEGLAVFWPNRCEHYFEKLENFVEFLLSNGVSSHGYGVSPIFVCLCPHNYVDNGLLSRVGRRGRSGGNGENYDDQWKFLEKAKKAVFGNLLKIIPSSLTFSEWKLFFLFLLTKNVKIFNWQGKIVSFSRNEPAGPRKCV